MRRSQGLGHVNQDVWQLEECNSIYRRPSYTTDNSTTNLVQQHASLEKLAMARNGSTFTSQARPLRHFYFRSAVGVFGPVVVLGYFIAIWRIYLAPIDPTSSLAFGPPGAIWVFYSWFVAGIVGLDLSMYGLAGIEAAMLMEPWWNVGNAMRLMMHADTTWSGPSGWMKVMKWVVQMHSNGAQKSNSRPVVVRVGTSEYSGVKGAAVTGFSYANFNERIVGAAYQGATVTWLNALDARIPGQGIVYTPEGFDRSKHPYLEKVPVVLPSDDGVNRIFLTAQAKTPIEGSAWGLFLQYNCSIVKSMSELSILKDRKSATENKILNATSGRRSYLLQGNSSVVVVQNQTDAMAGFRTNNLFAVAEIAHQIWPSEDALTRLLASSPNGVLRDTERCYFNKNENITGRYPDIDQERIFEILLWQQLFNSSYGDAVGPQYNMTLDHNITELYGAYDHRDFRYDIPANATGTYARQPMSAIGLQCKSSSSVGVADIDGVRSTYSNFVQTDTPINIQRSRCVERFGAENTGTMIPRHRPGFYSLDNEWLNSFFTSTAAPPLYYASYMDEPNSVDTSTGYMVQLSYLQASQLRQSMLRAYAAYAAYAVQLMYNGGQGFTARDGSHVTLLNPNITSFVAGTVMKQGVMPAVVPLTLFSLWAIVSTTLCMAYGFRKRWSAILDGHALFRLGTSLRTSDKEKIEMCSSAEEVEACLALNEVPALVGDLAPNDVIGKIGLVNISLAAKDKMYR